MASAAGRQADDVMMLTDNYPPHQNDFIRRLVQAINEYHRVLAREVLDVMTPILESKDLGDGRGSGVYSKTIIPPNTVVSMYFGDAYPTSFQRFFPHNRGEYFQVMQTMAGPPGVGTIQIVLDGEKYKNIPGSSAAINHSCNHYNCQTFSEDVQVWVDDVDKQRYGRCEEDLKTVGDRRKRATRDQMRVLEQEMAGLVLRSCVVVAFPKTVTIAEIPAGAELLANYNVDPASEAYFKKIETIYKEIQDGDISDSEEVYPCRCEPAPGTCPRDLFLACFRADSSQKTNVAYVSEAWEFSSLIWRACGHLGVFDISVRFPDWNPNSLVVDAGGDLQKRDVFAEGEVLASIVVIEKDTSGSTEFFPYYDKIQTWYEAFKSLHKLEMCLDGKRRVKNPPKDCHIQLLVDQIEFDPRLFHYFLKRAMKKLVARHCHALPEYLVVRAFELAKTNIHSAFWQR